MIDDFGSVEVDGFEVIVIDGAIDVIEGIDRLVDLDDGLLARLRTEESRARVRALAEAALERPAYGRFDDEGRRWRLLPGDPGHVEAALLSIPGAGPA